MATPGTGLPAESPVTVNTNRLPQPAGSTGTSGAGATSGAPIRTTGGNGAPGPNRGVGVDRGQGPSGAGTRGDSGVRSGFAQRASGTTVGTTTTRSGPVFAPGTAKGKKASSDKQRAVASTPSTRSASGDLWSGFRPAARSSVFAAEASAARQPDGVNGTVVAALGLLGLGLTGIAGAMAFVVLRTRRARSRPTVGGNGTTEM